MTTNVLLALTLAAAEPPLFAPPGMVTNDNWFARDGDTYHAFYLQVPAAAAAQAAAAHDWGIRAAWSHVGHATSSDLVHWTDHGPVLVALKGTWNDGSIATGSVVRHDGRWWMVYTGAGRVGGLGLAVSDDLYRWTKVGDGPVVPLGQPFEGTWQGRTLRWAGIADPYVHPEPIDGWYWLVLNSHEVGAPVATGGCLTVLKSRDLQHWTPGPVLAYPGWAERLETPQLWHHGDRWYLYAGVAHDHGVPEAWAKVAPPHARGWSRTNILLAAAQPEGPFEPVGPWVLALPDGRSGYIHKVFAGPGGGDVLLSTVDGRISRAYPVRYLPEGGLELARP